MCALNHPSAGTIDQFTNVALLFAAAWGVDNTLSRALADRDPSQVVMLKAALGASLTTGLAWISNAPLPGLMAALGLLAVGATGYGVSLRLYLLAQRACGAARTGSVPDSHYQHVH